MKNTTRHLAFLALATVFIVNFSGVAQARGYGGWGGGSRYGAPALTQEQQVKYQQVFSEQYENTAAARQEIIIKRAELQAQLVGTTPDKAKIESLSKEIGALTGTMLAARSEAIAQLNKEGVPFVGRGLGMGPGGGRGMGPGKGRGMGCGAGW